MLEKLGHKTAFIGKVGKDIFGKQLRMALMETGIFLFTEIRVPI